MRLFDNHLWSFAWAIAGKKLTLMLYNCKIHHCCYHWLFHQESMVLWLFDICFLVLYGLLMSETKNVGILGLDLHACKNRKWWHKRSVTSRNWMTGWTPSSGCVPAFGFVASMSQDDLWDPDTNMCHLLGVQHLDLLHDHPPSCKTMTYFDQKIGLFHQMNIIGDLFHNLANYIISFFPQSKHIIGGLFI